MGIQKWTPERRRQLTRDALIEAASEVFSARGYHAASLDEIAEAAGFTRGAIYSNFEDKEDLFLAVMDRHTKATMATFEAVLAGRDEEDAVPWSAVAETWQHLTAADEALLRLDLEFRLLALRSPEVRQRLSDWERKVEVAVAEMLAAHAASSGLKLPLPAEDLGVLLFAASQGLQQHVATCTNSHPNLFRQMLDLVFGQ